MAAAITMRGTGGLLAAGLACAVMLLAGSAGAHAQDLSACRQTRDVQRALTACTNIIERRGTNPASKETLSYAHHRRANARRLSQDRAGAIADYTSAIGINDKDTAAYLARGQLHLESRDWSAAERDYRKAIELRATFAPAHVGLGRALAGEGQHQQALASYDEALRLAPGDRTAVLGRSEALTRLGRLGDALQQLATASQQHPDDAALRSALEAARRTQVASAPPAQPATAPPPLPVTQPVTQPATLPPLVAPLPDLEALVPSTPSATESTQPRREPIAPPAVRVADQPTVVAPAIQSVPSTPADRVAQSEPTRTAGEPAPFFCGMIRSWSPHAAKYTGVRLESLGCQ